MSAESRELPESIRALIDEYGSQCRADGYAHVSDTPLTREARQNLEAALAHSRAQDSGGEAVAWVSPNDPMFRDDWSATTPILYKQSAPGLVPLYTAAEQPAKGEGRNLCCALAGTFACRCNTFTPQPSDPADAEVGDIGLSMGPDDVPVLTIDDTVVARFPKGSWGDLVDSLASFGGYTPPTAQRHDEDDIGSVIKDLRHSASVDGYTAQHRSFIHSIANRLAMLSTAHGAGAAVEAVALSNDPTPEMEAAFVDDYRMYGFKVAYRSMLAIAPPQQRSEQVATFPDGGTFEQYRALLATGSLTPVDQMAFDNALHDRLSEQVAGGGGVDALIAGWRETAQHAEDACMFDEAHVLKKCADDLAALSTQPLLSDQPGGVSDAMVERFCAAMFVGKWPSRATHNDNGLRQMVRTALQAALHPEQAKDGAAG